MDGGPTPAANWYPDPQDPAHLRYWDGSAWTDHTALAAHTAPAVVPEGPADADRVLRLALAYGLLIGIATGAASGTVAAPVLGTVLGAMVGAFVALPVSLGAALFVSRSVGLPTYRRRVDLTLLVLGIATALLSIGWISLRALVGPWPALTMLLVVVIGLSVARGRLQRLAPN